MRPKRSRISAVIGVLLKNDREDVMDKFEQDDISPTAISRRVFAATSLVVGFTLAAGPVSADAIITDTNGLDAGEVSIPVSDGKIPGYRAKPSGKTNLPTILVVQEVFGVHEHIRGHLPAFRQARLLRDRAVALCALWRSRQIRHGSSAGIDDRHRLQGAGQGSDVRSRFKRGVRKRRRRRMPRSSASPASAGADASSGSMRRTIPRSRLASLATDNCAGLRRAAPYGRSIRSIS